MASVRGNANNLVVVAGTVTEAEGNGNGNEHQDDDGTLKSGKIFPLMTWKLASKNYAKSARQNKNAIMPRCGWLSAWRSAE